MITRDARTLTVLVNGEPLQELDGIVATCATCQRPIRWFEGISTHVERDGETVACRHFSGRTGRNECPESKEVASGNR